MALPGLRTLPGPESRPSATFTAPREPRPAIPPPTLIHDPMNTQKTLSLALPLLALPLFAFTGSADKVTFQPAEGATTSKELTLNAVFYLDDMRMVVDGNEMPAEMMGGAMEEGLLIDMTVGVTDEYVKSEENKMLELLRSYDELTMEAGPESQAENVDEFSELEDSTISFKWDADEGEYVKAFHESEGDDDLLENLEADMDFMALLPRGEVSEGDTWEAKGKDLGGIFLPGGMPGSASMDDAEAEEMEELFKEEIETQLETAFEDFAISCTYMGTKEEGDVAVGVIEFKFEGDMEIDLADLIQSVVDMQAGEMDISADIAAMVAAEFEGEGVLLWNMKAGHMHGFEMSGDLMVTADIEGDIDAMGEAHSMEMAIEASGEISYSMESTDSE